MNERHTEIIVSRSVELVLGSGQELITQQVGVGYGRLDLVVSRPIGTRMVMELKKGRMASSNVEQVRVYAADSAAQAGSAANSFPKSSDVAFTSASLRAGTRLPWIHSLHQAASGQENAHPAPVRERGDPGR